MLALAIISSVITLFMGVLQVLVEPLVLSFADSKTLGIAETVCACGMLASGIVLGVRGIKRGYVRTLSVSLALAGVFMAALGLFMNIVPIVIFGFLFFATLPFANNALDYLVRTNIADNMQGRAWGLIGFISQSGYVVAYAISGVLADLLGSANGGVGQGAAIAIRVAGVLLFLAALAIPVRKSVRKLEKVA